MVAPGCVLVRSAYNTYKAQHMPASSGVSGRPVTIRPCGYGHRPNAASKVERKSADTACFIARDRYSFPTI
jgi:hypothetical protein